MTGSLGVGIGSPYVRPGAGQQKTPRRWPGTVGTLVGTPLALAACAWGTQGDGADLVLLLCVFLGLAVLCVAWAMSSAGPGTCVAVLGFGLVMFLGPAMNDFVLDQRGTREAAVIARVEVSPRKHYDAYVCRVVVDDHPSARLYTVEDSGGCSKRSRADERTVLVTDPEGWLEPRMAGAVKGPSGGLLWTVGSLLAGMEAFILYGRLRRRRG